MKAEPLKQSEQLVCGHPNNKVTYIQGHYHCQECNGKWKEAQSNQLPIHDVSKSFNCECAEPLELQYDVGLTIFCEKCGKNVKQ